MEFFALLYSAKLKWNLLLSQLAFVQDGSTEFAGFPNHAGLGSDTNMSLSKTFWKLIFSRAAGFEEAERRRDTIVPILLTLFADGEVAKAGDLERTRPVESLTADARKRAVARPLVVNLLNSVLSLTL